MHKLTFYPLGNADTCLIETESGAKILFDYANVRDPDDEDDKRIDLAAELKARLADAKRRDFNVVAFTHGDTDHICGASEFFYLDHAAKYQSEERIKISELWVPAAMILEENLEGDAVVLRSEARHRLKKGYGIRVFSRPERLKDWLATEGLTVESRAHLITDAGNVVPGFSLGKDGLEFFAHSPFAARVGDDLIDRNECCLVVQARFSCGVDVRNVLLTADTTHEVWKDIVNITKYHGRDDRLAWDIFKIPHHCSYLSLNAEKGKDKTTPIDEVKWLLDQGTRGSIQVSESWSIPKDDADDQPPHRQAADCYREVADHKAGEFVVTMEHPSKSRPDPVVVTLDGAGATLKKLIVAGAPHIIGKPAPRAG